MAMNWHDEMSKVRAGLRRRERTRQALESARRKLQREMENQARLGALLRKEGADVERLEGTSLNALFYSLLGNRDEKLDRERQEYVAAKLQYDRCCDGIKALRDEIAERSETLRGMGDLDERMAILLARRERELRMADPATADELDALADVTGRSQDQVREVREALGAGQRLVDALEDAYGALEGARKMGVWDMMGGGMVATAIKHGRLDDARSAIHRVQSLLGRFERELADVAIGDAMVIQIDSFETFADYVLDGLISDWLVQKKIHASLARVNEIRYRVTSMLDDLRQREGELVAEVASLERRRRGVLERM